MLNSKRNVRWSKGPESGTQQTNLHRVGLSQSPTIGLPHHKEMLSLFDLKIRIAKILGFQNSFKQLTRNIKYAELLHPGRLLSGPDLECEAILNVSHELFSESKFQVSG